jgi:hypothetical protein
MWEYGFVVKQITLFVKAYHLAASAEARINAHDTFLPEWCGEKQLSQVFCKHEYGIVVGTFLAELSEFCFYRWLQESFVAVVSGFLQQLPAVA